MNWINNIALDLFFIPLVIWNVVTSFIPFAGLFNWFMSTLNFLPNVILGIISSITFAIPDTLYFLWKALPFMVVGGIVGIIQVVAGASTTTN